MSNIQNVVEKQINYYKKENTRDVKFRIQQLKKLKDIVKDNEEEIMKALYKDLRKSNFESYATEIGLFYEEINLHIKNIHKWVKKEKRKTPISHFPAKSYICKDPYGVALIIGPFNYPFMLTLEPLVGAMSAGNCAVIKPSEQTINTALLIEKLINENFNEEYIHVVNPLGGKEVVTELLEQPFNKIFFTGSVRVGKIIMEKAARRLIPVTLELGGKSPCIVDKDANLSLSAKRIVWGKFLNAGQTCVAPDYLYIHKDVKEEFLKLLVKEIKFQFGQDAKESNDYPRLVNSNSVERLKEYIIEEKVYYGGEVLIEDNYIEPTILNNITSDDKVMQEEIFGPIIPVLEFNDLKETIEFINENEKPLALYYFSESKDKIDYILNSTTAGGVTINDTIIHVASSYIPFGGVGSSGVGAYHGKASFDTFTHSKSVLQRGTFMELPVRFAPYGDKIKYLKMLMK